MPSTRDVLLMTNDILWQQRIQNFDRAALQARRVAE